MSIRIPKLTEWLLVPALAGCLISANADEGNEEPGFSMKIINAFKISGKGTVLTGIIESGAVSVGDSICLTTEKAGQHTVSVEAIEVKRAVVNKAQAGDMPGIMVDGIDRNDITVNGTDRLTGSCSD